MNRRGRARVRLVLGILAGVVVTFAVAGLSRLPTPIHAEEEAAIRLSWRMAGLGRAVCRPVSPEEQEDLPVHMRRTEECEDRPPAYRLTVDVDGIRVEDRVVRGGGVRGDRPLVVHREIRVAPGEAYLEVRFEPEADDPELPSLHFAGAVDIGARSVVLITLGGDAGVLTAVGGGGAPSSP